MNSVVTFHPQAKADAGPVLPLAFAEFEPWVGKSVV